MKTGFMKGAKGWIGKANASTNSSPLKNLTRPGSSPEFGLRSLKTSGFNESNVDNRASPDMIVNESSVPTLADESKAENIAEIRIKDYEVKKMESSTVTKTQSTGRGRYSNAPVSANRDNANGSTETKTDKSTARRSSGSRDLNSGLELLELDFLLGVVEGTDADSEQDVTMRKLIFNELIRTQRVHEIDSHALSVYAVDSDGHFGKDIQFQCIKELADRTATKS